MWWIILIVLISVTTGFSIGFFAADKDGTEREEDNSDWEYYLQRFQNDEHNLVMNFDTFKVVLDVYFDHVTRLNDISADSPCWYKVYFDDEYYIITCKTKKDMEQIETYIKEIKSARVEKRMNSNMMKFHAQLLEKCKEHEQDADRELREAVDYTTSIIERMSKNNVETYPINGSISLELLRTKEAAGCLSVDEAMDSVELIELK
jgi:hypothetical protein